jgi:type II restriction-modification system restriction subunit
MIKMTPKESYLFFLKNCTTANKSANNYSDFTRINETIATLKGQPSFDIYSILEVSELDRIIESLQNDEDFLNYNSKGNNQYTNALAYYRRYLLALQLSQAAPSKKERSSVPLSLQIIYFGAPGSGKSHKVAEDLAGVGRENVFRTTFHPDYDYASFVGCYKPEMRSEPTWEESYTLDELLAIIPNEVRVGENYPVEKFCLRHYRSIEKLNISSSQKNELRVKILQAAKNSDEQQAEGKTIQTATVLAGAALGRYLEDNGILSASGNSTAIAYAFTPQVFTNAYVRAWEHPNEKVYLVIEEINRGNCAQIFGDLFQLLDRKDDGTSCYYIRADKDLADYLQRELSEDAKLGIEGGNLCLPSNLHIIATMNTSDQSLFPMDSAFKRRWDWEYVPINYKEAKSSGFKITIGEKSYLWIKFLEHVNGKVWDLTKSEDKQMGNFFIKGNITEEVFKSKVMAYLWHEICKDEYGTQSNFFRSRERAGNGEEFSFNQLYDGKIDSTKLLQGFMTYLDVRAIGEESAGEENE